MWDVENLSSDELESQLAHLEAVKAQASAIQIALIAEADRRQLATWDGSRNLAEWVSARMDVGSEVSKRLVRLSKRLNDLPEIGKRLSAGEIGPERASALSTLAQEEAREADVLEQTRGLNLATVCRLAARHRRLNRVHEKRDHESSYLVIQPSLDESWWTVRGGLTGTAGEAVSQALRQRADLLPQDSTSAAHRGALALESICLDSLDQPLPDGSTPRSPLMIGFLDLDHETGGETGAELAAGPRIGPAAIEELLCEGSVCIVGLFDQRPVVTTGSARNIPPAVRSYVLWRDGGCRAAGCGSRHRLQPHHIRPRRTGGHDPDNLITLCWFHHHVVVHRRGMRIARNPDDSIRFVHPNEPRSPP